MVLMLFETMIGGEADAEGWMTLQDEYGQTYYYNVNTGAVLVLL